jgi:hypothetical protein
MESKNFIDTLPTVTDRVFVEALGEVIQYLYADESCDFVANPRPDHMLVNLMILLTWLRDFDPKVRH